MPTAEPSLPRLSRLRLRTKITLPYVVLALLVGMAAAYLVTRVIVWSVEARFERQLADSGHQATDAMVVVEQDHLGLWRQIRFTQGFAGAVAAGDRRTAGALAAAQNLAVPDQQKVDAIDILDARGAALWAMHLLPGETVSPTLDFEPLRGYGEWWLVQQVLAGTVDAEGDKWADLVQAQTAEGRQVWMLYTAGPVKIEDRVVGVLLVGTRLDNVVARLDRRALARVTLYTADGQPIASTLGDVSGTGFSHLTPLSAADAARAQQIVPENTVERQVTVSERSYKELLTTFLVRNNHAMGLLSVAQLSDVVINEVYPARDQMIALFTAAIVAILLIGAFLAEHITRPVQRLARAAEAVSGGDLTQHVDVRSGDEIGVLAQAFNGMVAKLRERQLIVELFGHYVGDEVRDEILGGRVQLGGERREVSVLFADIRGFASLAERSDAHQLLATLNEYFTDMIDVIEQFGGLVNKFGGDSTLAVFGVPLPESRHARRAVRAALEMTQRLERLNRRRATRGEPPIRIGIGINTGAVIAGNVGSVRRLEYTVIGDAVNVAQRLSDLNKDSGLYSIFISGTTYAELGGLRRQLLIRDQVIDLGPTQVKGKAEPVQVYAILAHEVQPEPAAAGR